MNYPFKTICCIISSPCHLCNLEYDKVELDDVVLFLQQFYLEQAVPFLLLQRFLNEVDAGLVTGNDVVFQGVHTFLGLALFIRCQPWRAKRRLVDPSSREAALFSRRALRQRENKVGLRTRRPVIWESSTEQQRACEVVA